MADRLCVYFALRLNKLQNKLSSKSHNQIACKILVFVLNAKQSSVNSLVE